MGNEGDLSLSSGVMVTAEPFTSRTVPMSTLPETRGCPGFT